MRVARPNRVDGGADPLDEQDRALWDRGLIEEGTALVTEALTGGPAGWYAIQAAIAAVHDEAPSARTPTGRRSWPCTTCSRASRTTLVALNHAIAAAMVHGHAAGLELLDALDRDKRMAGHYRLDAVRGHLLERAGDRAGALAHYRAAAEGTASLPERNYLLTKAARSRRPGFLSKTPGRCRAPAGRKSKRS